MKSVVYIITLLSFLCCSCEQPKTYEEKRQDEAREDKIKDSLYDKVDNDLNELMSDTNGIHKAPVQVIKASFIRDGYSSYKDIQLTYKNVSGKDIDAIKFSWTGTNAFGDPADVGAVIGDVGGGFTDHRLRAGKTTSSTWSVLSRDGKKVTKAWAYEVVFSDGTKWEFKPKRG